MSIPRRSHLAALAALTVVSVGAGVLAVPASAAPVSAAAAAAAQAEGVPGTASAASPILVSGTTSWNFKASWVGYVTGMGGSVTVAGGATKSGAGLIGYPVKHGAVDPAKRNADVRFGGSVTYAVPSHGITAITLANPRVVLKNGVGSLFVDLTTDLEEGKAPVTTAGVELATLQASAGALTGGAVNWTGITSKLTAKGAEVFAYQGRPMYEPGTALDPVAIAGTTSVPTLTVSQVTKLGEETQVTVEGKGYQPDRGVYLAQSVALNGTTYPSVYGNAAWVRKVGADGTFTVTAKITETFTSGATTVDCRTTACFVTTFNSHDGTDPTWMPSRAQDVAQQLYFGDAEPPAPPATVTQQPTSRTARSGANAVFTAAATGYDTVRWERSTNGGTNWTTVDGATSTTLTVKASAALNSNRYRAVFVNASAETATSAATLSVTAVPARIISFNASPEPVAKGGKLKTAGTLQTAGATNNTWSPLAKAPVVIEFQAKGSKKWSKAGTATTNSKGAFAPKITAKKDGTWRARYAGTADRAAATSSTDYVDVKLKTSITGFNASPEPVRKGRTITVKGTLNSLDGKWKKTSGQSVNILFKAKGSKKWTKLATVRTNSKGVFTKGFTAKKDGTWKAQFKATSARLASTSGGDYVDVR
ncbi:HtaA domain-containing protein [Streptomyces sp. NPDC057552]|uniref:HtaA domain-containing protein n=1 Tax=Streptomyces sp. NPDC057552 TaxID=3350537 RepID=UPI0036CEA234